MLDQQKHVIIFLDFLEVGSSSWASQSDVVWHARIVAALDTRLRLGELRALRLDKHRFFGAQSHRPQKYVARARR